MEPALCAALCEEYTKHINRLRMEHNASLAGYRRELDKATQELDKLIDMVIQGVPAARVKDRMHILELRQAELALQLEQTPEAPALLHPAMANHYRAEISRLIESLNTEGHRTEAATIIRSLVDRIVLTPDAERKYLNVDLIGDLAGILAVATNRWALNGGKPMELGELQNFSAGQQDKVVAGAGFEPTTFRL
jgi:site-specific DNA recombinase